MSNLKNSFRVYKTVSCLQSMFENKTQREKSATVYLMMMFRTLLLSALLGVALASSCRSRPDGAYCMDNAIVTCQHGRVKGKSIQCADQCVIATSGIPTCIVQPSTRYNTFCANKRDGVYCDPGDKHAIIRCADKAFVKQDACGTETLTAVCLDATFGDASCIVTSPVPHPDCLNATEETYWCDDRFVYHCANGLRDRTLLDAGQTCMHGQRVAISQDLTGTKNCGGKPQGYYCSSINHHFYYCPGSHGLPEETLSQNARPTSCIALWPYMNTIPPIKCTEIEKWGDFTVQCSI